MTPTNSTHLVLLVVVSFLLGFYTRPYTGTGIATTTTTLIRQESPSVYVQVGDQQPKQNLNGGKILCMVLTSPLRLQNWAVDGVESTWGQRCDKLVFVSSKKVENISSNLVIDCQCTEGYDYLWGKVKNGFRFVHKHFNQGNYDWFVKADDDTYIIVDNLRQMLSRFDSSQPLVFGRRISAHITEGYMAGGSGYVLSKSALAKLVNEQLNQPFKGKCKPKRERGVEDVEMGVCLHASQVDFVDTRDPIDHLETFIPHDPIESLTVQHNESFWLHIFNYYRNTYQDVCLIFLLFQNLRNIYLFENFRVKNVAAIVQ